MKFWYWVVIVLILCGCAGQTVVTDLSVSGCGAVDLELHEVPVSVGFCEYAIDVLDAEGKSSIVLCTVVEHSTVGGVSIGSGYIAQVSHSQCGEFFAPLRLGGGGDTRPSIPAGATRVGPRERVVDTGSGDVDPGLDRMTPPAEL